MYHWAYDSIFYHIYPLGLCGAPERNDFQSPPTPRLDQLYDWIPHMRRLNVNALYLGPLFESTAHGYDTADYYWVDRRLGDNGSLARLVAALHANGIRVILDGVFNHVGRDFWAFRDVRQHLQRSPYCDWFQGLAFDRPSSYGDPFSYAGWSGHYSLVKLNLRHPDVKTHLLQAVETWMRDFDIDGLRLDVADCLDMDFMRELRAFCSARRPDFWLMGEVVHGNYRDWANPETLHSVTNYECYKGLYSSHVDKNYFEIAYSLKRQFGEGGLYEDLPLYNFADNHDVSRVASMLTDPAHLYPLYCLLFTMPGVPSLYYGSEWGLAGQKDSRTDRPLRPQLDLTAAQTAPHPDLARALERLAGIRQRSPALKYGAYRQLHVGHEQLAFSRQARDEHVIVVVNAAAEPALVAFEAPEIAGRQLVDLLNPGEVFWGGDGKAHVDAVPSHWARILAVR
ncbi:MAG: alpha-glucosidase C-terminal domain-containing protein [Anaerolineae bacterium]|nr:alpha-glucosidase C-terminal domain-containing protein [Anaerolineae bacterium]